MDKAARRLKRQRWTKALAAQASYTSKLRSLAKQIGTLVRGLAPDGDPLSTPKVVQALQTYAKLIEPWAGAVANAMVQDVARREAAGWRRQSKEIGRALSIELQKAPTGAALRKLQAEQVELITSLPLKAAERVHELSQEALVSSTRAKDIAQQILNIGDVTEARATLIARTEVARASSNLLQARATFAGSDGYIWRTSGDADVRESHHKMEGVYVRWSSPPTLDKMTGHAGTLPNCRCFAEPVFRDDE